MERKTAVMMVLRVLRGTVRLQLVGSNRATHYYSTPHIENSHVIVLACMP